MSKKEKTSDETNNTLMNRRKVVKLGATGIVAAALMPLSSTFTAVAAETKNIKEKTMSQNAFVYTELQISIPFKDVPWQGINEAIKKESGFLNKTWLSGVGNQSAGGLYAFETIEDAQKFVTGYFPTEAKKFGVGQTTRIFDAEATQVASQDMNSMHYDGKINQKPGAFLYTEIQVNVPSFEKNAPWRDLNPMIKKQPGFMSKTWLSGLHTGTVGGFYAFDTVENAQNFAFNQFTKEAAALNAAFYTRIFDANVTEPASRDMNSPFYLSF